VILAIAGSILAGAALADGLSTVHFLKMGLGERNPLFGEHPSKLRLFGEGAAIIVAEITVVALLGRYAPRVQVIGLALLLVQAAAHIKLAIHNFSL
jgi:hypothetical protein